MPSRAVGSPSEIGVESLNLPEAFLSGSREQMRRGWKIVQVYRGIFLALGILMGLTGDGAFLRRIEATLFLIEDRSSNSMRSPRPPAAG